MSHKRRTNYYKLPERARSKSNNITPREWIEYISSVQRASKLNIVPGPDIEGFYSKSKQYRVYKERLFGASSISYPISYPIYFLVPKQEPVFHVRRRLTKMKIAKWTLTINVITWTKIFILGSSLLPNLDPLHCDNS